MRKKWEFKDNGEENEKELVNQDCVTVITCTFIHKNISELLGRARLGKEHNAEVRCSR